MLKETHIYCVPGMGANERIFEFLKLPQTYVIHIIPWKQPKIKESLQDYAKRMAADVTKPNPVLIGVSFGGIVVQEMKAFLNAQKIIIISSVKSKYELPVRLQVLRDTKLYKLLPTKMLEKVKNWEKLVFGPYNKKRARLYNNYMMDINKQYLDWAIENVLQWDRKREDKNVVHIHGEEDKVFPVDNIQGCILVPKADHSMILTKALWFNEKLPKLIES